MSCRNIETEISKICRACLKEGNMMSIFKVHINKKLMACASVQAWQNDGLPSQICNKCVAKLHISFQFKKQCEKSDSMLRQWYMKADANKEPSEEQKQKDSVVGASSNNLETQTQSIVTHQNQVEQTTETIENACVFVECAPILGMPQPEQEYQHSNIEQIEYTMQANTGTINGYNLQTVYNGPYSVPLQQIQTGDHTIIQSNQILVPSMQMQQPQSQLVQQHVIHQSESHVDLRHDEVGVGEDPNLTDTKRKLDDSVNTVDNIKECSTCRKVFTTSTKLKRHMKIHNKDFPYKCEYCNKTYSHSGNFRIHLRMHADERPYKCTVCNHACRQAQDLEKHLRTHTGEKPHKCPTCSRAFSTSSNLSAHIRTHTGEKPYVCSVCEKGFCQSTELTKHMRTHTGEKSHVCDICGKGFNGSSTLNIHRRIHTGERPYVCKICLKDFTQSTCLKVHMMAHQNNASKVDKKPKKKKITPIPFDENDSSVIEMRKAMQESAEIKPDMSYQCTICPEKYATSNALVRHVRKHTQSIAIKV